MAGRREDGHGRQRIRGRMRGGGADCDAAEEDGIANALGARRCRRSSEEVRQESHTFLRES